MSDPGPFDNGILYVIFVHMLFILRNIKFLGFAQNFS